MRGWHYREWHYIAPKRRKQGLRARILHAETRRRLWDKSPAQKTAGVVEWFRVGEYERVARVLADLKAVGVKNLRTSVSWADWCSREGQEWYAWLFPRLAAEVTLLPCFLYTPPSLGVVSKTSSPPREPKAYADFLDLMITRFGAFFDHIELWNQPSNLFYWDWRLDPEWWIFSEMVGGAAYWAQQRGKKTVPRGSMIHATSRKISSSVAMASTRTVPWTFTARMVVPRGQQTNTSWTIPGRFPFRWWSSA